MKPTSLVVAVAVLLLAAFLRFHNLEVQSFWNDEGNSARLSERPLGLIVEGTASDVHPPFYYLALHGWRAATGESEFSLRALSALAGVLTVAATMALARALARHPVSVMAVTGLLAAVSPPLVYYAQETRMYALLALFSVLSTWILWQWVLFSRRRTRPADALWLIAYGLLVTAGLYTHYFFPAVILAQGLLVVIYQFAPRWLDSRPGEPHHRFRLMVGWLVAVVAAVLLYAVWIPIFMRQIGGRAGQGQDLLTYLVNSGTWLGAGTTLPFPAATFPPVAGLLLLALGIVAGRRRALLPVVMAAAPIGGSYLAGATDPAFFKFLLTAVPFLCILGGLAFRVRGWLRVAPITLALVVLAGSITSLTNMFTDPAYARADYRAMAQRIATDGETNAAVILNAPNQWEVFTYYHREGAPVYPLPKGQPNPAIVEPELASIAAAHDRLYVLFWGDQQRDPQRVVEQWLDTHTFKASEEWVGDVRFVTYAVPNTDLGPLTAAGYTFDTPGGSTITLDSYAVQPRSAIPGDIVQLQLFWQTSEPISKPYKVFVHLLDEADNLVAQRDSEPAGGSAPTTSWAPGITVVDNHGLLIPADTPPGNYQLVAGLYDPFEPSTRLQATIDGVTSDTVPLGTIMVR